MHMLLGPYRTPLKFTIDIQQDRQKITSHNLADTSAADGTIWIKQSC